MSVEQITTIIVSIIQSGALLFLGFQVFRGLRERISSLEHNIEVQKGTLAAMKEQISETQKITDLYRCLLDNLPKDIANYNAIISSTKDSAIVALKQQNEEKDEQLKEFENKLRTASSKEEFPLSARKQIAIQDYLLLESSKDFLQFLAKTFNDIRLAVKALEFVGSFEELVTECGMTMEISQSMEALKESFSEEDNTATGTHMIYGYYSARGGYTVRSDGRLLIVSNTLKEFQKNMQTIQLVKGSV